MAIIPGPEQTALFPGFQPTKKRTRPESSGLTKLGARLLSLLHRLTRKTGYAYARQIELARMLGCTDRQVRRCLEDLAIRGHVHWQRYGARNRYFLGSPVKPKCPDKCPEKCPVPPPKMSGSSLDDLRDMNNSSNGGAAAAEKETTGEEKSRQAITIFAALGVPEQTIRRYIPKDTDLFLEAARHCEERFHDGAAEPVSNRIGYAINALRDPASCTILMIDGVWKRPPPIGPGTPSPEDRAKADAELIRQREEEAKRDALFRAIPVRTMKREETPCPR